jgi:hypothetical protein
VPAGTGEEATAELEYVTDIYLLGRR